MVVYFTVARESENGLHPLNDASFPTKSEAEAKATTEAIRTPGVGFTVLKAVSRFVVDGLTSEQAV